jgi:hypothetical protein
MRILTVACSLALFASFAAFTFTPAPPAGPGAIKTMLEGFFLALDGGDRVAAHACLAGADCTFPMLVYDLGLDDQPVTTEGREATGKFLDAIFDALKNEGIRLESRITKIHADCHSPELGYATLEFSQSFSGGGEVERRDYRATVLVTWGKDQSKGPKIFHWHGSMAPKPAARAK